MSKPPIEGSGASTSKQAFEVFISHQSTEPDTRLAQSLADHLRAHTITCFLDIRDLHGGESFIRKILANVRQARVVVVLVSGEMSSWVQFESACAFFDEKLLPVSIDGAEVPMPYRRIQHPEISTIDGESEERGLRDVIKEVQRLLHGKGSDGSTTRLYRRINGLFFSGLWILLAVVSSAMLLVGNLTEASYLHLNHLHVTLGAATLGGQFFLSLGFARVVSSPSFREREYGFLSIERLLFVWMIIAVSQPLLGVCMLGLTYSANTVPAWIWLSLNLYLASLLCTGAGYAVAKNARELDRAHDDPRTISSRHLMANLLFLIGFLLTVAVINIMIERDQIFGAM